MKRLFLLVAMAIALAQSLRAQDDTVITVGDSTSSSEITAPVFFNWNNSYTQSIYLASELQAGGIVSISYYYPESTPKDAPSVIYMAEVPAETSSFSSTSDWVPASSLTEVYSGNVTFTHGWNTIELTAPFPYSGEGNLVVAYVSNNRWYENLQFASMTTSGTRTLVAYSDDYACDPATIGSYYGNKISKTEVSVTRFVMGDISGFCFGPGNLLVSDITANEAVVSWTANESSTLFALEYRKIGQSEWTQVTGITDTEYTLNGLDPFAMYEVKVYAVCSEGNSTEAQTTFRTLYDESSFLEFPYSETFDDFENFSGWAFQNGPNGWYLGTAVNNTTDENGDPTEGGALYISNDGGTTNAYTYNAASYSYAYSLVNIPEEGETVIKFDWRNNAEECCDHLNVYLLPLDQELPSSSLPSGGLTGNLNQSSTWQTHSIVLPSSYAGNSYKLVFAWRNDGSVGNNPPAAVDNIEIYTAPCAMVEDVSIERMEDGATASVQITVEDSRNENAEYVVEYRLHGTEEWLSETSASPVVLSDLVYRSLYEMKITAQCGEELSLTSDVINFSTSCIAYDEFPATESFEVGVNVSNNPIGNQAAPLCWNNIDAGSSSYYFFRSSSQATTGTVSLAYSGVYSPTSTAAFSDWMITPIYSLTGGEMATFNLANMSTAQDYAPASVDVLICNVDDEDIATTADTSRFELVATITHTDLTTSTFMHQEVNLSEYTGNHRLALAVRRPSRSFLIDDFAVETAPDCPTVYGVQVQLASQTGASVNFSTANGAGNGWIIAYGTAESAEGFDPAAAANTQAVEADAELPILVEGLEAGTTYYFAVQQNCGGEFSEVVSLSVPSVNTLPYTENFNDPENVTGWAFQSNNTVNGWYIGAAANNPTGEEDDQTETGGALYVSNDGGTTVSYTHTSTSAFAYTFLDIEAAAEYNVSFDYSVNGESGWDDFSVYLVPLSESTLDNTTYRIVNNTSLQTSWAHMSVAVSGVNFAPGLYRLVFKWRNDGGGGNPPSAAIDNISVTAVPCGSVQSVTAQAVLPETVNDLPSVVVDFTDANGDDITYVLRYKASSDSEWTEVTDLTREDFPYTIPDLAYQTTYQIGMAVACSEGELTDYTTTTISTPCSADNAPWMENFDVTPFTTPTCWSQYSGLLPASGIVQTSSLSASTRFYWGNYSIDGETSGMLRNNVYGSTTARDWLISPPINLGQDGIQYSLVLKVAATSYSNTNNPPQAAPDDRFAILISTDGGGTWDVSRAMIYADGDEDTQHNYSDFTNEWSYVVYNLVDEQGEPLTGSIRFALYVESTVSNGDNYLYIDDIAVTEMSDCSAPVGLSVSGMTENAADVSFTELGGATSWEYALVEGSGEDIDFGAAPSVEISQEDLPLHIDGLSPATTYTIAIRSICGDSFSPWSGGAVFKTAALPAPLPYSTDFEDEQENNAWFSVGNATVNKWAIGSATFAGDQQSGTSAYISNDGGTSYAATLLSSTARQYLYRDIDFGEEEAVCNLSFDWKAIGRISGTSVYCGIVVYIQDISDPISTTDFPSNDGRVALLYGNEEWGNELIELPPLSGHKRLLFLTWGYTDSAEIPVPAAIDNVSIELSPCLRPQNVSVSEVSTTTAEVSWEGSADSYIISYRESADSELTTINATSSPYTLTDLNTSTRYLLAVQGVCGGETSPYSNTVVFTTECVSVDEFPYFEGFENGLACWNTVNLVGSEQWTQSNGSNMNVGLEPMTDGGAYFAETHGDTRNNVNRFISPVFDLTSLSAPVLSFYHWQKSWGGDIDKLKVYYRTSGSGEWTQIAYYPNAIESWTRDTILLPNPSETYQLAFEANFDYGYGVALDNISIYESNAAVEPCDAPTGLAVSGVTQTGATVTWNGSASGYEVRLNGGTAESVTATTKTYTDLTASTSYTVEVRSVCTDNNSAWVSTTFTTLEGEVVVTPPTVATLAATNVTYNGATLNGTITAGTETITAQGFRYKTSAAADWTEVSATGTTITATLSNLTAETAYDFKAFATTATGTVEGTVMTFTTSAAPIEVIAPTVATLAATNVTHNAATLNGTITAGNETITAQGFRYKTAAAADWTTVNASGTTITATLTDLTAETAYEFKAFATTASGTVEGSVMTFTTAAAPIEVIAPTVTTMAATSVTSDGATLNGTIVAGNEEITAQGFIYKQDGAADWTTEQVAGENIAYTLTGLASATTYRFKAFATTASGTVEGAEMSFTTLSGLADVEGAAISAVIYPNPASERATLSLNGLNETAQIVLTDVQGRIILTDSLSAGAKIYELNVKSLASGVYYVRVIAGSTIATKKLIVE